MKRPDLHMHTTASDGIYTPTQLVHLAHKADITFCAVTDHDTVSGIAEAATAARERGMAFASGVELSAEGEAAVHILGYGVCPENPVLRRFFAGLEEERIQRFRKMAEKLLAQGLRIDPDAVIAQGGPSVGRVHLARALMQEGYVQSVQEAFSRYLGRNCSAYVPRAPLAATKAISFLRQGGATPVLAHPGLLKWPAERFLPLLSAWQDAGLQGLEVYHPANARQYAWYDRLARSRGLLVTGGSDYHDGASHGQLGETISTWPSACEDAWALFDTLREHSFSF